MQNLVTASNATTGWTVTAATLTVDGSVLTPSGGAMLRLVEDGTTAVHLAYPGSSTLKVGRVYTYQVVVKKQSSTRSFFVLAHSGGGTNQCWFDFSTGLRATMGSTILNAGMDPLGNGYYLCWISFVQANAFQPICYPAQSDGGGTSFAGDGASYYLIGDVQLSEASSPTSFVGTAGAARAERPPRGELVGGENYFLQSENLAVSWTGVACSAGTGTNIDGVVTNCALVEDGTNAGHYFTQTPSSLGGKDRIMVARCLAKAGTRNYLCIAPAGAGVQVTFDLTTGVGTFNQGSGVNSGHRLGFGAIPLKDGWFDCYVIFRQDTAAIPVRFYAGNSTTGAAAYTGTNGNKAIYIDRMQLAHANGPTQYEKTTTAVAAPRARRGMPLQNLISPYINDPTWAWTGVQAITADATLTPWGTTAYRLVENTGNSAHAVQAAAATYVQGRIQSMRVRLKAGTRTWAIVGIGGGGIAAWINLSTGAFGTTNGFIEKDIRSLGDGWYEVSLSAVSPNAGGPTVYATSSDGVAVYTGDGASYILVAETQMTEGRAAASQTTSRQHSGRAPRALTRLWNLCKSSQNLHGDTTNWTAIGSVVRAASSFMAPDGSMTASNLSDTSNAEYRGVTQAITVPKDARSYCFSLYIRGGSTTPVFGINAQIGGGTTVAMSFRFDPSTGQFTNGSQRSNAERVIAPDGSPWYRIWCVLRNNGTNNTLQVNLYAATSTSIGAGDTVAGQGNVDLWGAQINEGEGPTDYVATTTTAIALPGAPARVPEEPENLIVSTNIAGLIQGNILTPTVDIAAPTGTLSYRLRENSTAGVAHVAQGTISNLRKGNVVTMSCLAKVGVGRTWLALGGNSGNSTSWFDIQNAALGNVGALLYGSPTIRALGSGWVFCSQSFILDPTTPLVNFYLASANGVAVYNGDGASYMLISDIQVTYSNGPTSKRTTYPYNQALDRGRPQRALIL